MKHIFRMVSSLFLAVCLCVGGGGLTAHAANPYVVNKYDLTDVGSSDNTDLKCVWVSTYDATHHWDYCVNHKTAGSFDGTVHGAGGIRGSKVAHVKTNNGIENKCHAQAPYRIESCACGWSQNVAKPAHTMDYNCVSRFSLGWSSYESLYSLRILHISSMQIKCGCYSNLWRHYYMCNLWGYVIQMA